MTELIMVIVIVGILFVTVAPRMFNTETFTRHGFYSELKAALRYAQKSAIAANCPVNVTIVANDHADAAFDGACAGGPAPLRGFNEAALRVDADGIPLAATSLAFAFDGAGRTPADVTITVGPPADLRTIVVHGGTGYVEAP